MQEGVRPWRDENALKAGRTRGRGPLADVASIDPNIEGVIYRPKWQLIAMHGGMMGAFAFLFWRRPRELVYLTGYIISLGLTLMMLYTNVGVL